MSQSLSFREHAEQLSSKDLASASTDFVLYRDLKKMCEYMVSTVEWDSGPIHNFIIGPRGVGKTFNVRHVLEDLKIPYNYCQFKWGKADWLQRPENASVSVFDDLHYACQDVLAEKISATELLNYAKEVQVSQKAILICDMPLTYYKISPEFDQIARQLSYNYYDIRPPNWYEYIRVADYYADPGVKIDLRALILLYLATSNFRFLIRVLNTLNGQLTLSRLHELIPDVPLAIPKIGEEEVTWTKGLLDILAQISSFRKMLEDKEYIGNLGYTRKRYKAEIRVFKETGKLRRKVTLGKISDARKDPITESRFNALIQMYKQDLAEIERQTNQQIFLLRTKLKYYLSVNEKIEFFYSQLKKSNPGVVTKVIRHYRREVFDLNKVHTSGYAEFLNLIERAVKDKIGAANSEIMGYYDQFSLQRGISHHNFLTEDRLTEKEIERIAQAIFYHFPHDRFLALPPPSNIS